MLAFKLIVVFIYIISFILSLEDSIAKSPQGRILLEGIKNGSIKLFQWLASVDARESLRGLSRFTGWTISALFLGIWIFGKKLPNEISGSLAIAFFAMLFFWTSIKWFLNFKQQLSELRVPFYIIITLPWLMLLLQKNGLMDHEQSPHLALVPLLVELGFTNHTDYFSTALLSGILAIGSLLFFCVGIIFFLIVPAAIFLLLVGSSKVSNHFSVGMPIWLRHALLVYYFFVTTYMAAGGLGLLN
ncbi:hypothetical protein ACX1DW_11150 [Stutzerimonas sp. KH-1]